MIRNSIFIVLVISLFCVVTLVNMKIYGFELHPLMWAWLFKSLFGSPVLLGLFVWLGIAYLHRHTAPEALAVCRIIPTVAWVMMPLMFISCAGAAVGAEAVFGGYARNGLMLFGVQAMAFFATVLLQGHIGLQTFYVLNSAETERGH